MRALKRPEFRGRWEKAHFYHEGFVGVLDNLDEPNGQTVMQFESVELLKIINHVAPDPSLTNADTRAWGTSYGNTIRELQLGYMTYVFDWWPEFQSGGLQLDAQALGVDVFAQNLDARMAMQIHNLDNNGFPLGMEFNWGRTQLPIATIGTGTSLPETIGLTNIDEPLRVLHSEYEIWDPWPMVAENATSENTLYFGSQSAVHERRRRLQRQKLKTRLSDLQGLYAYFGFVVPFNFDTSNFRLGGTSGELVFGYRLTGDLWYKVAF